MKDMKDIKVALIGFGGIARFHNKAYKQLMKEGAGIKLVAVCDKNVEQFTKKMSINIGGGDSVLPEDIHTYTDVDELIAQEDFDMADICLPTFLHKQFVLKLLNAGKHVLCEKPMALNSADGEEMLNLANEKGLRLMIGLDLHFDPHYIFLDELYKNEKFGKLQHLSMWRHSEYPNWGTGDHFSNVNKSGGLTMDMHIHDIDLARHFFGMPDDVDCVMYDNSPHVQLVSSTLHYPDFPVLVEASWDVTHVGPFDAGYDAKFERATVVLRGGAVTVYPYDMEGYTSEILEPDFFYEEISYFASLVKDPSMENTVNPPECTLTSTKLIEMLREKASSRL